jgi:hypothetical protein
VPKGPIDPREQLVLNVVNGGSSPSDVELARLTHALFPDRLRYVDGQWFEKGASEPAYNDIPLRHLLIDAQLFIEDTLAKHRVAANKAPSVVPDSWRESRVGWALEVLYYSHAEKPSVSGGDSNDSPQDVDKTDN